MSAEVRELMERFRPGWTGSRFGRLITDTSDFMNITYGDVIRLEGRHYLVLRDEMERRFGLEDPKYWVKRCSSLEDGESRILKLVFHEAFNIRLGDFTVRCYRSPRKEARILDKVRGDMRFMQGVTRLDERGNEVRVLDRIYGKRVDMLVGDLPLDHETYFRKEFPEILERYLLACEALDMLHAMGEKHGDVRRDHLLRESSTGRYRWIDFDYTFDFHENPYGLDIFGLGSILVFLVGKGDLSPGGMEGVRIPDEVMRHLSSDDFSLLHGERLVNLRKVFGYIPETLNNVLLHFSIGAGVFYESVREFLDELRPCLKLLRA